MKAEERESLTRRGKAWITVRMEPELVKRIDAVCEERMINRSYFVTKILTDWLEGQE